MVDQSREGGWGRTHVDFGGILSVFTELFIKSPIDIHDYQEKRARSHTRKHMYCFDKESRDGRRVGGESARVAGEIVYRGREPAEDERTRARGEVSQDEKGAE